jgi:DNA-3-methyladenine glycosylase II
VLQARPAKLARIGLSAPKIRTLKAIARAVGDGAIDLPSLVDMSAEDAHQALTALHGIGPWTADIYLLFCLGHADAWPAGDLALQEATRLLLGLKTRPTVKEMGPLAEAWRPWRGAAACALWAYYRVAKKRDGAPQLIMKKSTAKTTAIQDKTMQNKTMQKKAVSRRRHGG